MNLRRPQFACSHLPAARRVPARGAAHRQLSLNHEIRRRTYVVGIFPDRGSIIRLVGAVLP